MRRSWAILLAALAVILAGCGGDQASITVPRWTFIGPTERGAGEVLLPAHLNDRLPDRPCEYRLRARVELPNDLREKPLTLQIVDLPALASLRAGGREAAPLDSETFARYRTSGAHVWRVGAEETRGGYVDLELTVQHRWRQSAWLDAVPELTDAPGGSPWFVFMLAWNRVTAIIGLATTLLVSTTYGLIFVLDRRRTVHAWHALQGFFAAAYPCVNLGILQPIFGTAEIALVAVLITLAAIASVYFVSGMFGEARPRATWWLFAALAAAPTLVPHEPFDPVGLVVPAVVLGVLAATVNGVVVLVRARKTGSPSLLATLAALGFPITCVLATPDMIALLGLGDPFQGFRGGSLALAAVSVLQAGALGRSHVASLNRADDLNAQLAGRVAALEATNREIGVLNDELRRQIAARSQKLGDALARVGAMQAPRVLVAGDVVDDRYRVARLLGEGGMGTVYEVARIVDGRRLALKVLQSARSGAELARLAREAEIAAQLAHPNVVGMVDVDVSSSGAVFLVMELVEGEALDDLSARYGDAAWARDVLHQVAEGLAALHARGIVHRDLKPGNVLVTRGSDGRDVAKIADFGIAMKTATGDETTAPRDRVTQAGQVLGTPLYMAPEVARGAIHATAASDVYALGVMGFELLTGEVPAGFDTMSHPRGPGGREDRPTPSFVGVAGLDPAVARLLSRAMARDPKDRPTAREIADALRPEPAAIASA